MVACRATQKPWWNPLNFLTLQAISSMVCSKIQHLYQYDYPSPKKTRPPLKKWDVPSISHPSTHEPPHGPNTAPFLGPRAVLLGQRSETIKMSPMRKRAKTCSLRGGKIPDSTATSSAVRCFMSRGSMSQPWRTRSSEMSSAPIFRGC